MAGDVTTGWVSEPDTRGTFRLVFSCLIALSLCVWLALHLNVPPQNQSSLRRLGRKIIWVGVGLLAPELVLYTAWYQWRLAKKVTKRIRHVIGEQREVRQLCASSVLLSDESNVGRERQTPSI